MKALSVRQPWASLIAREVKRLELRSRPIKYRGELLICSSAAFAKDDAAKVQLLSLDKSTLALGVTIERADELAACNPWREGLFAWELVVKRIVAPAPVKGSLGFFNVPDHLLTEAA